MNTQPPIQADPPQEQATKAAWRQIGIAIAGMLGATVGFYCGWQVVIPLAITLGVGWVLTKVPASPTAFRFAWALLAAQAIWMAANSVVTGQWLPIALPMLILVAGLAWLWVQPGPGPVILLGLYEVATGVIIVIALRWSQAPSWLQKLVVAQVALRVAAVIFLIAGYVKAQTDKTKPVA